MPPGHMDGALAHAFVWHDGTMTALPNLDGKFSKAKSINRAGDIAGDADNKDLKSKSVIWRKNEKFKPRTEAEFFGQPRFKTENGTAFGELHASSRQKSSNNFGMSARPIMSGTDLRVWVRGANESGTLVGSFIAKDGRDVSLLDSGDRQGATWIRGERIIMPIPHSIAPESPGSLYKVRTECTGINKSGMIVGWLQLRGPRVACIWNNGKAIVLPAPPDSYAKANSINDSGVIAGEIRDGRAWFGAIWRNGKYEDLNKLIPQNSGWQLESAVSISNSGYIVGTGTYTRYKTGYSSAFILRPVKQKQIPGQAEPERD
ncbi:MAG: hypothetical protein ABJA67_08445 [Chthonomonadales bacterium]